MTVYPAGLVEAAAARAAVKLKKSDNSIVMPTFYVSERTVNADGTATFKCYGGAARLETKINDDSITYNDKKMAAVNDVLLAVKQQCGFEGGISTYGAALTPYLNKDDVHEKSGREILEMLSEAWGGCWQLNADDDLIFVLPEGSAGVAVSAADRSDITHYGSVCYSGLTVTGDKDKVYAKGGGAPMLEVSSELVSEAVADSLWGRLNEHHFIMWAVDMCLVSQYISCGMVFAFDDTDETNKYVCSSVSLYPTAAGLFASVGRSAVSEDEWAYKSYTERNLSKKQNKGGKVTVFVNYNDADPTPSPIT